jgi:flagellar basal body rod protein FlgB
VDIDIEMAKLAEARMSYQALFRLLARKAASI